MNGIILSIFTLCGWSSALVPKYSAVNRPFTSIKYVGGDDMHWLDIFPKGKSDRTAPSGPAWKVVGGSSSNESTLNDNSSISDVIKGARDNAIADTIGSPGLRQMHSWRELESPRQTSSMPTSPPPTLRAYLYGTVQLEGFHAEKVQELWEMIRKRGSLRHLSESDTDRVLEALRIAYVTLYGKVTLRSLEEAINRDVGTRYW